MKYYSNEIVFRGHPDKVCDQISDALLDAYLKKDKYARCGIEVVGGKKKIFITGEVTSTASIDIKKIVNRVLKDIGYPTDYEIINNIGVQSPDIALGTNEDVLGAGDNGMMFGYACRDTEELLPTAMVILQKLSIEYDKLRTKDNRFLPDGKAQITGIYDNNKLIKIKNFTICYQNTEEDRLSTDQIIKDICTDICSDYNIEIDNFIINPTGKFLIGGFDGDAGLTGRKIVVDTYQSFSKVGGGAFSGKDPTKVDRSAAYKAREIAKKVLLENEDYYFCEVQISYAIGKDTPLAIYITTDKGDITVDESLYNECRLKNIIEDLSLRYEHFEKRSRFGHFIN
ncbi:MAG: methionine adenosyltransferase [Firmicutes bacterium]|nr:methionine adenosyltransferase [Bacillota bacterium]